MKKIALSLLFACLSSFAEAAPAQRPNIILILSDDVGFGETRRQTRGRRPILPCARDLGGACPTHGPESLNTFSTATCARPPLRCGGFGGRAAHIPRYRGAEEAAGRSRRPRQAGRRAASSGNGRRRERSKWRTKAQTARTKQSLPGQALLEPVVSTLRTSDYRQHALQMLSLTNKHTRARCVWPCV